MSPVKRHQQSDEYDGLWPEPLDSDEPELIAIDPGDAHVGVAFFRRDGEGAWYCMDAQQHDDPDGFETALSDLLLAATHPPIVVYERFRLYNDKAHLQTGSEFRTSQMIGVIKFVVRARNNHVALHVGADATGGILSCEMDGGGCADGGPEPIELHAYMADIKKPTAGILRAKGIKSVGAVAKRENKGWGDHCKDAELHGWYHILHTMKEGSAS